MSAGTPGGTSGNERAPLTGLSSTNGPCVQ